MPPPILFVTLDSCRYDAFVEARTPNLSSIGPLVRAQSPSHFTFASHAAYFMGFTPGNPMLREPYANPKYGKIFLMKGGERGLAAPYITLLGRNIIDGLKNEDGLWAHGVSHAKTLEVPLLFRLAANGQ